MQEAEGKLSHDRRCQVLSHHRIHLICSSALIPLSDSSYSASHLAAQFFLRRSDQHRSIRATDAISDRAADLFLVEWRNA